jgi:hypothetical protein
MTKKLNSLSSSLLIAYYNNQSLATRKILRKFIGPSFVSVQVPDSQLFTNYKERN